MDVYARYPMMTKLINVVYAFSAIFWLAFVILTKHSPHQAGLYFQILLFIIPFMGALAGFRNSSLWGGWKSALGRSILFLALGTLAWSGGMLIWNYYIFIADVEIPFPSLADAVFILSWPLWTIGVIYLSKITGVKFALRSAKGKIYLFLVPLAAIIISYYMLIEVARGGTSGFDSSDRIKLFFDLFYPIGTAVILAISLTFLTLSMNFLGGKYKIPIIVLILAFLVNYLADFTFSLTTTNETYFNGHFVDFLFLSAMYLLATSISRLSPIAQNAEANRIT